MSSDCKQRLLALQDLKDGDFLEGDSGEQPIPPADFDFAKFDRGRHFFREHIFSCSIGMFFSLIIGMSLPSLLQALVFTEKSDTPKKAFKRYLSTFRHVAVWHYGNIWLQGSEANKSILFVRKLHQDVAQRMKESQGSNNGKEFLSQYDMGVVQSGFMGSILMYSNRLGIKCSELELDDYVYFWYGVGHMLGIKKRYNICANGSSQAYHFCKDIESIVCENLQKPSPEFHLMTSAVLQAFRHSESLTLISLPVISSLSLEAMSGKYKQLSIADTIRYYIWKMICCLVRHFAFIRKLFRIATEKAFALSFTPAIVQETFTLKT